MRERNEGLGIFLGALLVLGLHLPGAAIAFFAILYGTALITKADPNNHIEPVFTALIFTPAGLWLYQLFCRLVLGGDVSRKAIY
jgi:uncharacterized membrane protein YozB (DUF420 family)